MHIQWLGQGCLKIQTKDEKGGKLIIVFDPPDPKFGVRFRGPSDIVLGKGGLDAAGEYEIHGIPFLGKQVKDAILWRTTIEEITIGHLGSLKEKISESERAFLTGVEILAVPVGGHTVLNAKEASELVSALEPKVIIPLYFKIPGLKVELDSVEKFCRESRCGVERIDKLVFKKKDIPTEGMKMVVFKV